MVDTSIAAIVIGSRIVTDREFSWQKQAPHRYLADGIAKMTEGFLL